MDNENVEPIKAPYLSVVVPLYFEESCIGEFVKQLGAVLREIPQSHEVILSMMAVPIKPFRCWRASLKPTRT